VSSKSRAAVAREAEERERDAWASATEAGSVAAFEAFRKNWPGSRHADAASKLIKEIQDAPSR
jgi:hypothetical protein